MVPARELTRPPAFRVPLPPGTVGPWQAAAGRAVLVTAAVVAFGAAAQWPLARRQGWLLAANLTVSAGFAAGSILLSDEPRHTPTRRALLIASVLWSVAWVQVWKAGPLPFIASLTGPAPALVAIWGLLRFPRPWRDRRASLAVLAAMVVMQAESAAMTFTADNPAGSWWPRVNAPEPHAVLLTVYNAGGIVATALLAGLFIARTARLRGHELRITVPIAVAVAVGGLATAVSDGAAALGATAQLLHDSYAAEDLLLACVPLSFVLSYILRRLSIEELSGRIGPYDTLAQARDKLRRGLRDPTLQVLVPVTAPWPTAVGFRAALGAAVPERWVDAAGREHPAPALPGGILGADGPLAGGTLVGGRLLIPVLDAGERLVAVVSAQPSLTRFGDLFAATVHSLALVLDNARILAQLRDEVSLAGQSRARVEAAVAAERRRIQHRAGAGTLIRAETARAHLDNAVAALTRAGDPVPEDLAAARATITRAAADIWRLSGGAEPLGLGDGLAAAISRVLAGHPSVSVNIAGLDGRRADPAVELVAYFVVTAAVGNAIKHAGPEATIAVSVTLAEAPSDRPETGQAAGADGHGGCTVVIDVRDDGIGGAHPSGHGLTLLAERVASVRGTLVLTSPPGEGTVVHVTLPPPARLAATPLSVDRLAAGPSWFDGEAWTVRSAGPMAGSATAAA